MRPLFGVLVGSGGFYPGTLFASGSQGAWYDPSDFTTLFQDSAGTTPITAVGQSVGMIRDKSGKGNHAIQASASLKPILRQDSSGYYYLEGDTVNDYLVSSAINFTATDKITAWFSVQKDSDAARGMLVELSGDIGVNAGTFNIEAPNAATATYRFNLRGDTTNTGLIASTYTAPTKNVLSCVFDLAGASRATEIFPQIDCEIPTTSGAGGTDASGGNFGNYTLSLLGRSNATLPFRGRFYGGIVLGRLATATEIRNTEIWLGNRCGLNFNTLYSMAKIDQASGIVSIYQPAGNNPFGRTYIHTKLFRYIAADADVWTIDGIWQATRSGYETFTNTKELQVAGTEILCAIQEDGKVDFMGGKAHGDEVITATPTLTVDGTSISLSTGGVVWAKGTSIVFSQNSQLYEVGSALTVVRANRAITITFIPTSFTAAQTISHASSYNISNAYLAMLAPHRYEIYTGSSEDVNSAQISGQFTNNVDNVSVSAAAYTLDDSNSYRQTTPRVTGFSLSGTYGTSFNLTINSCSPAIVKDVFYMNRASYAYNKGYIGIIKSFSGVQAVTSSTVWTMNTSVQIRSTN